MDAAISASTGLTILVTGAQSALGQAVVERLVRSGYKVYGSVKTADSASRLRQAGGVALFIDLSRATEIQANIKLQGIQVIVNLEPQQVNQVPYHKTAWDGAALLAQTAAIVQAAAAAGVQYLVHTSYAFVYGDQHGAWVDETAKPHTEGRELLRRRCKPKKSR